MLTRQKDFEKERKVIMKKFISYFMAFSLLFAGINVGSTACANERQDISWQLSKQKNVVTSSGIDCISEISVSEAAPSGLDENGKELYRKKVEIKSDFFVKEKGEYISGGLLFFYFAYNNDDNVFIDGNGVMKDAASNYSKDWKTTFSEEIYKSQEQCIVSQRVGIYNRGKSLKDLENLDEFHIDVICSTNGEISFNIKAVDFSENDGEKISRKQFRTEPIKKNLVREVLEKDKEYIKDLESTNNDRYRYITKEIYLAYKDDNGNLLADTTIQANFRYNIETREVQCISTSNEEQSGDINVSMRTGNETRTYGGAYGLIKLKYADGSWNKTFSEALIIKCDSRGKIITQFVN